LDRNEDEPSTADAVLAALRDVEDDVEAEAEADVVDAARVFLAADAVRTLHPRLDAERRRLLERLRRRLPRHLVSHGLARLVPELIVDQ